MTRLSLRVLAPVLLLSIAASPLFAAETAASRVTCDEVPGLDALPLGAGTVLLFGEIHGTTEAPDLVGDAVCQAVRRGVPVLVGLEMPVEERERVEAYLASDGSAGALEALLSSELWQREYQDGRSSRAMLALVDQLRRLRGAGGSVAVALFDETDPSRERGVRDRDMAERLAKVLAGEEGKLAVVLTGNVHARTTVGVRWDPELEPMGYLLARTLPGRRIVPLDLSSTGGTAWICTSAEPEGCGARGMGGGSEGENRRITLFPEPGNGGYLGTYHVGSISASPPAVPPAASSGG